MKLGQYFSDGRTPLAPAKVLHNPHACDVGEGDGEKHYADQEKIRIKSNSSNKEDRRQNEGQPLYLFWVVTAVENIDENEERNHHRMHMLFWRVFRTIGAGDRWRFCDVSLVLARASRNCSRGFHSDQLHKIYLRCPSISLLADTTADGEQCRIVSLVHRLRRDQIASIVPTFGDAETTEAIVLTKYYPSMPFSPREGLQGFYHAIEQDKITPGRRGGNTTIQVFV